MVVLKRIKASTLMETMVATVLIVIVFMISSMLLNNMFSNGTRARNQDILGHLNRLKYEYQRGYLELPYTTEVGIWEIRVSKEKGREAPVVEFSAEQQETRKSVKQRIIYVD